MAAAIPTAAGVPPIGRELQTWSSLNVPCGYLEHYISSLSWRPQAACGEDIAHLALTSLDGTLRLLAVDRPEPGKLDTRILRSKHFEGRLTGGCWTGDGEQMLVSCKNQLLAFEFLSGATTDVGVHEAAVCGVKWAAAVRAALSGSFDMTLRLWDARSRARAATETIRAADRVFGFDVCGNKVIAALADQTVALYDLRRANVPVRTIASPLGAALQCARFFADEDGFAVGGTDGRVAIRWFDESKDSGSTGGKKNAYTFKAALAPAEGESKDKFPFPLRCIETHPLSPSFFLTGSGCGRIESWDRDERLALRWYFQPKGTLSCGSATALSYHPSAQLLAYCIAEELTRDVEAVIEERMPTQLFIAYAPGPM